MISRSASSASFDLAGPQPVLLDLPRDQITLGDIDLLVLGVAAELDDLHAVAQRRRDRVEHVGRRDKEHLAQVKRHVEIVVAELAVLLRVEHLQQRAARVAAEVAAQLVDLVEHEDRVPALDAAQALDDAARHGADVGAPEAADVGLVADAAQRQAHKLAVHGARNADAQTGLADARRPDKTEHDALTLAANLVAHVFSVRRRCFACARRAACARPGTPGCAP